MDVAERKACCITYRIKVKSLRTRVDDSDARDGSSTFWVDNSEYRRKNLVLSVKIKVLTRGAALIA